MMNVVDKTSALNLCGLCIVILCVDGSFGGLELMFLPTGPASKSQLCSERHAWDMLPWLDVPSLWLRMST